MSADVCFPMQAVWVKVIRYLLSHGFGINYLFTIMLNLYRFDECCVK